MSATALTSTTTPAMASLATRLAQAAPAPAHRVTGNRLARAIVLPALLAAAAAATWSAMAPLAGAVVASGQVQAEFGRKVVQHQEGGLLRELLVRPGQAVRRGEPLLVLGDLRTEAALDQLRRQRAAEQLRLARAQAELALAPQVAWPADAAVLDADAREREHKLFEARRQLLTERVQALEQQLAQARARVGALGEQAVTAHRSAELARAELDLNRELVSAGFIQKTRLMTLERGTADADGRTAAARGEIAAARVQLVSLATAVAQARGDYRRQAADEVKDAGARIAEFDERLRPMQDQRDRQTVRAPVDGVVMALRVSAPGTAVGPREPLLEIAPTDEGLVVETLVEPRDIDHVRTGGAAEVRLLAYDTRRVPMLPATVKSVSPDATADAPGQPPHYRAQVEVSAFDLARHPQLKLQAGMPVEVFVATPERTLLQYLIEPLGDFARRAMREP